MEKKKKREREEIERVEELLESSSGSKGKIKEERMKEWGASGKWSCGSKEKEKGEDVLDNGIRVWWTKCKRKKKEKGNIWMKERQRIRNHNLKILPQYFHNIFTINFK